MNYFSISELSKSSLAKRLGIDNTPPDEARINLIMLIDLILDPLREAYGSPIYVNSGYRCEELNVLCGGSKNSHHMCKVGYAAADITTRTKKGNKRLFELAQELNLPFCQLIDEKNFSWIHISYNPTDVRRQILRIS